MCRSSLEPPGHTGRKTVRLESPGRSLGWAENYQKDSVPYMVFTPQFDFIMKPS